MELNAYTASYNHYTMGYNSLNGDVYRSLLSLAIDNKRNLVPSYSLYVNFFEGNKNYADNLIMDAIIPDNDFYGNSKSFDTSPEQRSEIVVYALQTMVLYMYSLSCLYESISVCKDLDASTYATLLEPLDEARDIWFGTSASSKAGGNSAHEGFSLSSLAYDICDDFNVCNAAGDAVLNDRIFDVYEKASGNADVCTKRII